jgi:hypothetical protein
MSFSLPKFTSLESLVNYSLDILGMNKEGILNYIDKLKSIHITWKYKWYEIIILSIHFTWKYV